jgi:integrase
VNAKLERTQTPGIYKRGNRYVVTWRERATGKQRRESAATLAAARDLKAKKRTQRGSAQRIRFAAYAPLWLEGYRGRTGEGVGAGTLDDYARSLEQDAVDYFGRRFLDEVTTGEVKRYVSHLERRGLAPASVAKALTVVRLVFASAVEDDDYGLPSNPALGVRVGRRRDHDHEPVKVLEPDELGRLLDKLPRESRLFFDFLFETGLRISEAIEVRWSDLDLGRGRLKVERQFYRGKLGKPKGQKIRTVRLSVRMAQELQQQRQAARDGQLVFTAERGGRLIPSNLMSRVLKPAAVKVGLGEWVLKRGRRHAETWVGFHTFRHTCATQLFLRGWNAKQVSVFLGHSDPAFTLRTYIHLLPEDLPEPWGDNEVTTGATETGRNDAGERSLVLAG